MKSPAIPRPYTLVDDPSYGGFKTRATVVYGLDEAQQALAPAAAQLRDLASLFRREHVLATPAYGAYGTGRSTMDHGHAVTSLGLAAQDAHHGLPARVVTATVAVFDVAQ